MPATFDAVFVSDVHLSPLHPATTDAFLRFVDEVVVDRTERLFLLGDVFETWAGDDDLEEPLARRVTDRLRSLAEHGIAVAFMAGNRDFLVGEAFAEAAGLTLMPDPFPTRIAGVDLLLSHGDGLCVDDVDYQRFRATVREAAWRRDFLAKPIGERRAIIEGARRQSEVAKRQKAAAIMDVNDAAVGDLLAGHPATILIHGHTHRPGRRVHAVDDEARERWVLTDWDADASPSRGGGLALQAGRVFEVGSASVS